MIPIILWAWGAIHRLWANRWATRASYLALAKNFHNVCDRLVEVRGELEATQIELEHYWNDVERALHTPAIFDYFDQRVRDTSFPGEAATHLRLDIGMRDRFVYTLLHGNALELRDALGEERLRFHLERIYRDQLLRVLPRFIANAHTKALVALNP